MLLLDTQNADGTEPKDRVEVILRAQSAGNYLHLIMKILFGQ